MTYIHIHIHVSIHTMYINILIYKYTCVTLIHIHRFCRCDYRPRVDPPAGVPGL